MKKYFFSLLVLLIISCGSTIIKSQLNDIQNIDSNKILWNFDRKLTWNDFKGKPRKNREGLTRAETSGEILTIDSYWIDDSIPKFDVRCFFIKDESWTVTDDFQTLQHEQIHFDIYEVYARKIRKAFDSLNKKRITNPKVYEEVFEDFLEKNRKRNTVYDYDVSFYRHKQQYWIDIILKELNDLKEYEYILDLE